MRGKRQANKGDQERRYFEEVGLVHGALDLKNMDGAERLNEKRKLFINTFELLMREESLA